MVLKSLKLSTTVSPQPESAQVPLLWKAWMFFFISSFFGSSLSPKGRKKREEEKKKEKKEEINEILMFQLPEFFAFRPNLSLSARLSPSLYSF